MIEFNPVIMRHLIMNEPSHSYFVSKYKGYYDRYTSLVKFFGTNCTNAKACLRYIYLMEVKERGEDFMSSIQTGEWPNG